MDSTQLYKVASIGALSPQVFVLFEAYAPVRLKILAWQSFIVSSKQIRPMEELW